MRKNKWFKQFVKLAGGLCLVSVSMGVVLGVSAATFNITYLDMSHVYADNDLIGKVDYSSGISKTSVWNCEQLAPPGGNRSYINNILIGDSTPENRYDYAVSILDGASHVALDKSFNQSAYNGQVNFITGEKILADELDAPNTGRKNSGAVLNPTNDSISGFNDIYSVAIAHGFKTLITTGYVHVTPIQSLVLGHDDSGRTIFKNSDFKDVGFILADGSVENVENVASILFRSDEAAFYSAISTCMYFMENFDHYYEKGTNISVGIFGGLDIPTVTVFMGGFQRGLQFFNECILPVYYKTLTTDQTKGRDESEYIIQCIDLKSESAYFTGTFVSGDAKGITQQYLNRGADAIIAVAGPQTLDVTQEIYNQGSDCIVIGVDTALENSDMQKKSSYTDVRGNDDIIKFSAVKNISQIIEQILNLSIKGDAWTTETDDVQEAIDDRETVFSFGFVTSANSFNGGVSVSYDGWPYILDAFKLFGNDFSKAWNDAASGTEFALNNEGEIPEINEENYAEAFVIFANAINTMQFPELSNGTTNIDGNIFTYLDENTYFIF